MIKSIAHIPQPIAHISQPKGANRSNVLCWEKKESVVCPWDVSQTFQTVGGQPLLLLLLLSFTFFCYHYHLHYYCYHYHYYHRLLAGKPPLQLPHCRARPLPAPTSHSLAGFQLNILHQATTWFGNTDIKIQKSISEISSGWTFD